MKLPDLSALTAVLGAAAFLGLLIHKAWPWLRKLVNFINDVQGEDPRDGFPGRPGLMVRVQRIEEGYERKAAAIGDLSTAVARLRAEQVAMSSDLAGVSSDMATVKKELTINGGTSLKDEIRTIRKQIHELIPSQPGTGTRDT